MIRNLGSKVAYKTKQNVRNSLGFNESLETFRIYEINCSWLIMAEPEENLKPATANTTKSIQNT